jgi:predicted membrane channel-forming protein YqfA (hemolysin III family)
MLSWYNYSISLISLNVQVALCFFMSAYYHLMRSHSHAVFRKLLTLDIAGIGLCIAAADLLVSYDLLALVWSPSDSAIIQTL